MGAHRALYPLKISGFTNERHISTTLLLKWPNRTIAGVLPNSTWLTQVPLRYSWVITFEDLYFFSAIPGPIRGVATGATSLTLTWVISLLQLLSLISLLFWSWRFCSFLFPSPLFQEVWKSCLCLPAQTLSNGNLICQSEPNGGRLPFPYMWDMETVFWGNTISMKTRVTTQNHNSQINWVNCSCAETIS